jgi:hypothetical protein
MKMVTLRMPPFSTTLLGVVRGVFDHYGVAASDAGLYGGSGHAFLMNIHESLCPSGPYCWKMDGFVRLLRGLGVEMTDHGFFHRDSGPAERGRIEALLKERIDRGVPCSLLNMENQLITGYDETGFLTAQPWPGMDFPPGHLSYGSWSELGDEVHVSFFSYAKCAPSPRPTALAESLRYAMDLYSHPERHTDKPYAVGAAAYAAWVAAVEQGHGASHGAWWNGMVWSECRRRAAEYLAGIATEVSGAASVARSLSQEYRAVADALTKAADKALDPTAKAAQLADAGAREARAVSKLPELIALVA